MPAEELTTLLTNSGQYGIGGFVIAVQFYFILMFIKKLDSINEMHNDRHDKRNELHAAERREWIEVTREMSEAFTKLSAQFEMRLK